MTYSITRLMQISRMYKSELKPFVFFLVRSLNIIWSAKPGEGFSHVCNKLWFDLPYISLNTGENSPNCPLWTLSSLWSCVFVCVCFYCNQMCNNHVVFSLQKKELKETACVFSLRASVRLLTSSQR